MRYIPFIAAAALVLAGCQPVQVEQPSAPAPTSSATRSVALPAEARKFCDMGRAIYILNGSNGEGGMAIVENAAECVQ
jgi:hypothetical protein